MPGIFMTQPSTRTGTNGASWARMDASFPTTQIFANRGLP